jgi:hypothetical protein
MLLQILPGEEGLISKLKRLFDPQGSALNDLEKRATSDPAFGQSFADAARTAQFNYLESLKQQQAFAQADEGRGLGRGSAATEAAGGSIFRDQTPEEQVATAPNNQGPFNPLAPLLSSAGLDPEDARSSELTSAIMALYPATVESQITNIQRRDGTAERAAEVVEAQQDQALETALAGEVQARLQKSAALYVESRGGAIKSGEAQLAALDEATAMSVLNAAEAGFQKKLNAQTHAGMLRYYEGLSQADRNIFDAIIRNPAFFTRQLQLQRMGLDERLARLQATTSRQEMIMEGMLMATEVTESLVGLEAELFELQSADDPDNDRIDIVERNINRLESTLATMAEHDPTLAGFISPTVRDEEDKPDDSVGFPVVRSRTSVLRPGAEATEEAQLQQFAAENRAYEEVKATLAARAVELEAKTGQGLSQTLKEWYGNTEPGVAGLRIMIDNAGLTKELVKTMQEAIEEATEPVTSGTSGSLKAGAAPTVGLLEALSRSGPGKG